MRFCYVTPGSRTPRRYRCQPDLAEQAMKAAIPQEAIGPPASVPVLVDGADPQAMPNSSTESEGAFNLQLKFYTSNPAPSVDDVVSYTLTIHNNGPRNANGIEITIEPPVLESNALDGCMEGEDVSLSQGHVNDDNGHPIWEVGDLEAGKHAMFSIPVEITGVCTPPEVVASITAFTWQDDGQDYIASLIERERTRVKPRFTSTRYGNPGYAQLMLDCSSEITQGADDESEMGVFHDLFQPQRMINLESRLEEYVPAGMDIEIIFSN
jgi:hypothetical protein